jgi:2-dehydro-3-deoxy-D-gluconate 5-dehydrogenase
MVQRFSEKVVIVTGASRGLGQAIAVAFAREGAKVVGVARTSQAQTAAQVNATGAAFIAIKADLSQNGPSAAADLVANIIAQAGRIDVLVNNAGIIRRAPAIQYTEKDWADVLQVNLTGPFFLTQAVARAWLKGGGQPVSAAARLKIIFIASLLSFQGGILVPAYTASKHGIAGITKALANEWAPLRINVNAIAPGYIATENTRVLREDAQRNQAILDRIPEGRWGNPPDVAGACLFLASDDAGFINGAILNVDGGWLAR